MSGMDWESAWEASLLDSTAHCEIWGYDFSVSNVRHVYYVHF